MFNTSCTKQILTCLTPQIKASFFITEYVNVYNLKEKQVSGCILYQVQKKTHTQKKTTHFTFHEVWDSLTEMGPYSHAKLKQNKIPAVTLIASYQKKKNNTTLTSAAKCTKKAVNIRKVLHYC